MSQTHLGLASNLIHGQKAEPFHFCQLERIALDDSEACIPKLLHDLCSFLDADAIGSQVRYQVSHADRFLIGLHDLFEFPFGYAFDLQQLLRVFVQDLHGLCTKGIHDSLGNAGAYAFDQAGAEECHKSIAVLRYDLLKMLDLQLKPVLGCGPLAGHLHLDGVGSR